MKYRVSPSAMTTPAWAPRGTCNRSKGGGRRCLVDRPACVFAYFLARLADVLGAPQVEVHHSGLDKTYFFPCNKWLEKEECRVTLRAGDDAVSPAAAQYRVTVHTTDCRGAGTDSDISCIIYGDRGDTGTQKLDTSKNNFEKGQARRKR